LTWITAWDVSPQASGDVGMVNLLKLENGERFEIFCKALLTEHCTRFQAFSAPDSGVDGYDEDTETVFQFYFPERAPLKNKILRDIQKILSSQFRPKAWILVIPKDPSPAQKSWVETGLKDSFICGEIWGATKIDQMLRAYPRVREEFFPTEIRKELRRLAKGEKPRPGDADGLQVISGDESEELRQLIIGLAEESAARKRRKPQPADYSREYSEFKSHFELSSYDRLNKAKMGTARRYLQQKLLARRNGETARQTRQRYLDGIHAIANKLHLSKPEYRSELNTITGCASLNDMDMDQLALVFKEFRKRQGLLESQSL
jgi:hypothetical protein